MGDWLDELEGDDRVAWDRFVENARRDALAKIESSAFVMSLVPSGEVDIKFAVELGISIMLDKPIVAVVMPGAEVPEKLRAVADEVVEADVDLEEGRRKLTEAIDRRMRALEADE